jgi:hypothetical protein
VAGPTGVSSVDLLAAYRAHMGLTNNSPDWTVVRILGAIQVVNTAVSSVQEGFVIGAYISNQIQQGAQALTPLAAPFNDWMLYKPVYVNESSNLVTAVANVIYGGRFDSKAMRKLRNVDDSVYMSFESVTGAGYSIDAIISVGFKLP